MAKEKTNRIVIYQVKPSYTVEDLDFSHAGYTLKYSDDKRNLYIHKDKLSPPSWVDYIEPLMPDAKDELWNKSCSFILVIKHNTSNYILCGGYGFTEITDFISEDFGLNMALRMIDEKEICALNQKAMKGTTRQIIRAVAGYDPVFDRDNYTRILNTIEGKAQFEGRKFRIVGKSSLALRTVKDINHIDEVLNQVELILEQDEKVPFPKSYKLVKDQANIVNLENLMFSAFQGYWNSTSDRDCIYLEFADPFAQFKCDRFSITYKHQKIELEDFDLDLLREKMKTKGFNVIDSVEELHKMSVTGFNEGGLAEIKRETIYNLIVYEAELENVHYIKIGKQWFQILEEVQKFIDDQLLSLAIHNIKLPDWNKATHLTELDYNKYVADHHKWECMDQEFVYVAGHSKLELCDVYDHGTKTFYHIKETWGSKSAYLFTQGITAVETYNQSVHFRKQCSAKWPQFFSEDVKKGNIVYGIANPKAFDARFPLNMTYFAKLNLYNAVSMLKQLDFNVTLAPIRVV